MTSSQPRALMRAAVLEPEATCVPALIELAALSPERRAAIATRASALVTAVRGSSDPGMMEAFLAEYGLSTDEGIALMCLAEALLRVPDAETIDDLIQDKIAPHDWGAHVGDSGSILVNASTWALMLTGQVLEEDNDKGIVSALRGMVRRLGEPVIRTAVARVMREMGAQFVLGRTIEEAMARGRSQEQRGYTYSYDMLGEAARTHDDAQRYDEAYTAALAAIGRAADAASAVRQNPGISVKLSALHPRYEVAQADVCVPVLRTRLLALAQAAKAAGIGLNVDAEEADRLDLSLDVIEAVIAAPSLRGWDGFGVVVQAYGQRARHVIKWIYEQAERHDRRVMVRLVKGAYWDSEIKRAQVLGLDGYPVLTRKVHTDVSYIACARRLLTMADRIYPQFATHNAHTVAAILDLADRENVPRDVFEFQRLHGMGDALHDTVMRDEGTRCRIYAPVGAHRDLLAYLVRRLLENGANSSFVHQIIDERVAPEVIAADPFAVIEAQGADLHPALALPRDLYGRHRINAGGYDLTDPLTLSAIEQGREPFARGTVWSAGARGDVALAQGAVVSIVNPAKHEDEVGRYNAASAAACHAAIARAGEGQRAWADRGVTARGACLRKAAELYEAHAHELLALLAREAGKTLADGVAEIREAVDFLRYYAHEAEAAGTKAGAPRGVIVCISPWNFPLAIFTGQIAAALVTGNAVIAKPAEQTSLIAARAIALLHTAGIDEDALQLVCGEGESVGAALVRVPGIAGVCFTGSTAVAGLINRQLARTSPEAMLIAETGGLNAMVVDSTALPEQAVRDIIASAFQSAGQRCSALRMLYVQADIADDLITMLKGAMATLKVGDPWALSTDVGPVIDAQAMAVIDAHCNAACAQKRVIATAPLDAALNDGGTFCAPTLIEVGGIEDLESEIFGPVLHVARFEADALGQVVRDINAKGYGLTFGLHSRIDRRVQDLVDTVDVGNLYINRNQIGAVVGAQPFGGEGLSGTGPKAGGPHYLARFRHTSDASPTGGEVSDARDDGVAGGADDGLGADARSMPPATAATAMVDANAVDAAFEALTGKAATWARRRDRISALRSLLKGQVGSAMSAAAALDMGPVDLPGPTGESNRLWLDARKRVLCLGPDPSAAAAQAVQALRCGCAVVIALQDHAGVSRLLAGLMEADAGEAGVPLHVMAGENPCAAMVDVAAQATLDAVAYARHDAAFGDLRRALAQRDGPIVPIIDALHAPERYGVERAVCIDTTAAGGNATLLATTA